MLPERLARSEYFRLYLDRQWTKIVGTALPWYWSDTSKRLAEDIRGVGRRTDPSTWGRGVLRLRIAAVLSRHPQTH
jgi:hypothetical protein